MAEKKTAPLELIMPPGYDPARDSAGFWFDEDAARLHLDFYRTHLKFVKGRGARQPFTLQPWQASIVANLFGWKNQEGLRRYREVFIYLPRKQGKSTLVAGIVLDVGFCDHEPGAEIYSAASTRDQASLVFKIARDMVLANPKLIKRAEIFQKAMRFTQTNASYKAISADVKGQWGQDPHCIVIDELHALPNRDLVDALITGTAARTQPIVIYITTADQQGETICNEKYEYACAVRDGKIKNPAFLPVIYEAVAGEDWTDPKIWAQANPNLGVSVELSYLERECEKAKKTPAYENTFKRLHLNMKTETVSRWINSLAWDRCRDSILSPREWRAQMLNLLEGMECFGGLDLGSTGDLTALALLFDVESKTVLLPWFWIPQGGLARKDFHYRSAYEAWINEEFITVTSGDVTDYDVIRADVNALGDKFGIRGIAVDRLFQGAQLCTQLQTDGFEIVAWPQSMMGMTAPSKEFEARILARTLAHGGNPVLTWMANNCAVKEDHNGNFRPVKPEGKHALKIDGIVASIMALGRMIGSQQEASAFGELAGAGWQGSAWGETY